MLLNGVQHPGAVPTKPFPAFGVSSPNALEQRSRTLAARSLLPLPYQPGAGFWLCLLRAQRPGSCADCQVGNHPFVTAWGGKAPMKFCPPPSVSSQGAWEGLTPRASHTDCLPTSSGVPQSRACLHLSGAVLLLLAQRAAGRLSEAPLRKILLPWRGR